MYRLQDAKRSGTNISPNCRTVRRNSSSQSGSRPKGTSMLSSRNVVPDSHGYRYYEVIQYRKRITSTSHSDLFPVELYCLLNSGSTSGIILFPQLKHIPERLKFLYNLVMIHKDAPLNPTSSVFPKGRCIYQISDA